MDKQIEKNIKRIKKAEELTKTYRKLKILRDPTSTNGITRILITTNPDNNPKTCTDWTEINILEEITTNLLQYNQMHFGQAKGTPFTIAPLDTEVNFSGTTIYCQLILARNSPYKGHQAGKIIMASLPQKFFDTISPTLTQHQFDGKIKNWPEETTTSPSNRHLGHIHALYKPFFCMKVTTNMKQLTQRGNKLEKST